MSNFDKLAKEILDKRTEQETIGLKDEIWNGVEKELFSEESVNKGDVKNMKKKNRVVPIIITTAAALLIAFSLQTDTGMAFMKGIKDLFVPTKEVIQSIEGTDEATSVNLNEGANSEYIIYVDETRYKMINGEKADVITTIEPLPEKYPKVTMEVRQVADQIPEDLVKKIEAELKRDFPELEAVKTVTEPVEGYLLHGLNGSDWDAKVVHAYVISNGKDGSYIITENYFLEAAEGHGARFHHMLESFEIVE
ncbi:hypothetical protein FQ087_15110 [Sporosarcina sp. ANT_H38]|uniref:hypothetical protein n=1 Tax=Sporosarcina sp. ANT_H38 TaxID=2597358 RepID=UPI0011F27733|nr:hypothetical protein [Sporosarcina sp. ANT_H38]KAA0955905.1 hypothetical protein FQ087_15110 [Sporosarcina sp. ANT_H38]